ncbi:MAG TPA: pitrilysin family protein [Pyrinomonadaceae bacterium]|jgi:zinc protease|nr:pitrilysin family protein [Pyrinomonadaceae bacterium]
MKAVTFRRTMIVYAALVALITIMPLRTSAQQETPPPPSAPRSVSLPHPVEKTLRNGLRVIVIERGEVPLAAAQLLVKTGGEADPAALSGLANLTAALLTEGTATRTAPQIAEAIEALGGSIESGGLWDASVARVGVMSSKLDPAMAIMADIVRNPAFKEEEIERQRQQLLDQLAVDMSNPGRVAGFVASRVVFGASPYGHLLSGTPESIARIRRDDIVKFHATYYRPDNAILVIGGKIKPDDAFKMAERVFGDWQKPVAGLPAPAVAAKETTTSTAPRVLVVDKPDAGQAAVVLVRTGLKRTDPDYFRGIVTNSVLTGYSGRLNQEIRIKRGLSYGARSSLDVRRDVGPFIASTQTKNPSGAQVASLLVSELNRLSSEAVTETELVPRKAVLIGNFGRSLETVGGLVTQISSLALYGLDLDEINSYIKNVQAVTASDIQKFAGSRLAARDASIIIVGNASDFIDELRKQFPSVEVIRESELDLNAASLKKSGAGAMVKE